MFIHVVNACSITNGRDLVSYLYQSEASSSRSQIKRDNPQPVYQIQSRDLSTPLTLGAISLAVDINRKLATIDPKLKMIILNLFLKTEKPYLSLS